MADKEEVVIVESQNPSQSSGMQELGQNEHAGADEFIPLEELGGDKKSALLQQQ